MNLQRYSIVVAVAGLAFMGGCMPQGAKKAETKPQTVTKGDLSVEVIETGSLKAVKTVEVKSRVSGRVKKLFVEEGTRVVAGQLIAEIDPTETQLQVDQNSAQVRGAEAGARNQSIQIAQRRITARNALEKAKSNLRQIQMELKIQPSLTRSSVASGQSGFDQAKQALTQLENVTQPNARTATEIALRDAQNSYKTAQNEAQRMDRLLEQGYVAKRDTENAQLQLSLSETKLRNAQENMDRLKASQDLERQQAVERVKQARAQLDQNLANTIQDRVKSEQYQRALREVSDAQAQLRDVEALKAGRDQQMAQIAQLRSVLSDGQRQLGETRILAPVSGVVTNRPVQVGELVSSLNSFSAGTTVFRIEDRSQMVVSLSINEIDVAKLALGTASDIRIDAFPNEKFFGTVTKIAPANLATAGSTGQGTVVKYEVEVTLAQANQKLKSGMSAKCTMKAINKTAVLKVPIEFVGTDDSGAYLMSPPKDPKNTKDEGTKIRVTTGVQSSTMIEIVSGAKEGQEIVKPAYKGPKRQGMMGVTAD